jgi:Spy/CpxP family protein refolding chaperone
MSATNLLETAVAGRAWNPKVACGLALTLVFLCGGVIGALAMDLVVHNRQRPAPFDTPQGKTAYFEKMQKDLNLTREQSDQIQSTLNDFWQYYRTVLSDARQRIELVLTPEQKLKFEQLLQEQRR